MNQRESDQLFNGLQDRILALERKFAGYWTVIDRAMIRNWLRQFDREHIMIALKLLENVDYYDQGRVINGTRQMYIQLSSLEGRDLNKFLFATFTPPGKSGDELLSKYRLANNMRGSKYDRSFIHLSDFTKFFKKVPDEMAVAVRKLQGVVFVDDFVGTGNQAIKCWNTIEGFLTEVDKVYLSVLAGYDEGVKKIENETRLRVIENQRLYESAKVFSSTCGIFTEEQKSILLRYCEIAGEWPEGFGGCQSFVVFYYRIPNNTISALRAQNDRWRGLFLRY